MICSRCEKHKPENEFNYRNKKTGKRNVACRECTKGGGKRHYDSNKNYYRDKNETNRKKRKEFVDDLKKGLACIECGEDHIACLHFHHRDPVQKDFELSRIDITSKKRILEEIAKCDVLCANCHAKLHYNMRKYGSMV